MTKRHKKNMERNRMGLTEDDLHGIVHDVLMEEIRAYETYLTERTSDRVFHFTSVDAMIDILRSNTIYFQSSLASSSDNKDRKRLFYFSLSRNKDTNFGFNSSVMSNPTRCFVRIEFDGDALNRRYKIKPIDYWGQKSYAARDDELGNSLYGKGWNESRSRHTYFEYEDRIMSNESEMYPAGKYIRRIDVYVCPKHIQENITSLYTKMTFFYDDINEFNRQSDKNIKDIFKYLEGKDLIKQSSNRSSDGRYAAIQFGKLLYGPLNMPINKIANIFRKYNLERFLDVRKITYCRTQGSTHEMDLAEISNVLSNEMHNMSRDPNETSQRFNKMVTDTLRNMGIGSWPELKKMVFPEEKTKDADMPIRYLKFGYYTILEPDKISIWNIYTDRDSFINDLYRQITEDWNYSGQKHSSKDDEHLYKYLQHIKRHDFSFTDLVKILRKFNLEDFYDNGQGIKWETTTVRELWYSTYSRDIIDFRCNNVPTKKQLNALFDIAEKQAETLK